MDGKVLTNFFSEINKENYVDSFRLKAKCHEELATILINNGIITKDDECGDIFETFNRVFYLFYEIKKAIIKEEIIFDSKDDRLNFYNNFYDFINKYYFFGKHILDVTELIQKGDELNRFEYYSFNISLKILISISLYNGDYDFATNLYFTHKDKYSLITPNYILMILSNALINKNILLDMEKSDEDELEDLDEISDINMQLTDHKCKEQTDEESEDDIDDNDSEISNYLTESMINRYDYLFKQDILENIDESVLDKLKNNLNGLSLVELENVKTMLDNCSNKIYIEELADFASKTLNLITDELQGILTIPFEDLNTDQIMFVYDNIEKLFTNKKRKFINELSKDFFIELYNKILNKEINIKDLETRNESNQASVFEKQANILYDINDALNNIALGFAIADIEDENIDNQSFINGIKNKYLYIFKNFHEYFDATSNFNINEIYVPPFFNFKEIIDELIFNKNNEKLNNYLANKINFSTEEKENYIKNFLTFNNKIADTDISLKDMLDTKLVLNYKPAHSVNEIYDFIKNNDKICNTLAMSESQIELLEKLVVPGDYTCFIVGQIKVVEILLKEILIQKFATKVQKFNKIKEIWQQVQFSVSYKDLTIENLSKTKMVDGKIKDVSLELGGITALLAKILNDEYPKFISIFSPKTRATNLTPYELQTCDFYELFVRHVRNGYFHVDQVRDYHQARLLSKITSYWTYRIIDEMINLFNGFKLK